MSRQAIPAAPAPVDTSFEELLERAETVRRQTGLNLTATVRRLREEGCLFRDQLLF